MKKRIFIASIFLIFIITSSTSNIINIKAEELKTDSQNGIVFLSSFRNDLEIEIAEDYQIHPIMPLDTIHMPLLIKNKNNGVFSSFINRYCNKNQITQKVSLSIDDMPEWCEATIDSDVFYFKLNDKYETESTKLNVYLTTDAPAFQVFEINITATSESITGFFNIPLVHGSKTVEKIPIEADYLPVIQVITPHNFIDISGYNETEIPIYISNFGNGKSEVFIEFVNLPASWEGSTPKKILIEPGEKQKIILKVKPNPSYGRYILEFTVDAKYFKNLDSDSYLRAATQRFSILLKENQSHAEYGSGSSINPIVLVPVVLFCLVIVCVYIIKRKNRV